MFGEFVNDFHGSIFCSFVAFSVWESADLFVASFAFAFDGEAYSGADGFAFFLCVKDSLYELGFVFVVGDVFGECVDIDAFVCDFFEEVEVFDDVSAESVNSVNVDVISSLGAFSDVL